MEEQKENINCPALLTNPARQRLGVLQVTKEGPTNGHSSSLLIQCFIEEFAFLAKELKDIVREYKTKNPVSEKKWTNSQPWH